MKNSNQGGQCRESCTIPNRHKLPVMLALWQRVELTVSISNALAFQRLITHLEGNFKDAETLTMLRFMHAVYQTASPTCVHA